MNLPKGWKEIKLSDIASHRTVKNKDSKYTETYTNSAMQGIVRQTEYFDKEISNKENIADYHLVEENDYVYNPRISAAAPCGPISKSHFKETGIMSPLYTVFRITSKNFTDDYLEQYFKSHFWHSYMKSVANYGARYDRMNITTEDFFNIPVPFPPLPEQEKIARILSAQDKVIALKQKLLQKKKQQKKYLMQKLLGADGTSFMLDGVKIDKSGWRPVKLGKLGTFSKGAGIKREEANSGDIPAIRYGEIYTTHNEYIKSFYSFISENVAKQSKLVKEGDILFSCSGETKEDIGKSVAYIFNYPAYAGGDIIVFSPKSDCDSKFLGYLLNSNIVAKQRYRYAKGDSIVHISTESLGKISFYLPSLHEQQTIAKILSAADKEIELLQKSIEQEKQKKKALSQLLLTGIVRVKI